jgi:hypothetical protein
MIENPHGGWVKSDDHESVVEKLKGDLAEARIAIANLECRLRARDALTGGLTNQGPQGRLSDLVSRVQK